MTGILNGRKCIRSISRNSSKRTVQKKEIIFCHLFHIFLCKPVTEIMQKKEHMIYCSLLNLAHQHDIFIPTDKKKSLLFYATSMMQRIDPQGVTLNLNGTTVSWYVQLVYYFGSLYTQQNSFIIGVS